MSIRFPSPTFALARVDGDMAAEPSRMVRELTAGIEALVSASAAAN